MAYSWWRALPSCHTLDWIGLSNVPKQLWDGQLLRSCWSQATDACDVSKMYWTYRHAYRLKTVRSSDFFGGIWKLIVILMYTNLNVSCSETHLLHFPCLKRMPWSMKRPSRLRPRPWKKSTYMDYSLDSTRNNDTSIQFHKRQNLWEKTRMKARKWLSNSPEVVIPQ